MKKRQKLFFILLSVIVIMLIFIIGKDIFLKTMFPQKYAEIVEQYSQEYEIDKNIVFAIIKNESNFEKDISSNKGAKGLMQLMDETATEVAFALQMSDVNLSDAETNIKLGTKYFSSLYKKYNNVELALAAYNAGTGNVDKWIQSGILNESGDNIEQIPYKETNMYVRKVMQSKQIYEILY